MKTITVNIRKPLYGTFVYIRGSVVEKAIRLGLGLRIVIPTGVAVVNPVEWKKNGKMMKKVFKFPDCPMILYGGKVPIPPVKEEIITPEKEKKEIERPRLF